MFDDGGLGEDAFSLPGDEQRLATLGVDTGTADDAGQDFAPDDSADYGPVDEPSAYEPEQPSDAADDGSGDDLVEAYVARFGGNMEEAVRSAAHAEAFEGPPGARARRAPPARRRTRRRR